MRKTLVVTTHATHEKRKPNNIFETSSNSSGFDFGDNRVGTDAKIVSMREIKTINTTIEPTKRLSKQNSATMPQSTPSCVSLSSGIVRF
mmetsp:Transcript_20324/g.29931  ORF Transcript_20324/g.29931 Transcript_20324/m.29931 type:complete len:89 (-) Transcript_20324:186-452(-)